MSSSSIQELLPPPATTAAAGGNVYEETSDAFLEEWIRVESSRIVMTSDDGFIAKKKWKKKLTELLCESLPRDFAALGHTPDRVVERFAAMTVGLAFHQDLSREWHKLQAAKRKAVQSPPPPPSTTSLGFALASEPRMNGTGMNDTIMNNTIMNNTGMNGTGDGSNDDEGGVKEEMKEENRVVGPARLPTPAASETNGEQYMVSTHTPVLSVIPSSKPLLIKPAPRSPTPGLESGRSSVQEPPPFPLELQSGIVTALEATIDSRSSIQEPPSLPYKVQHGIIIALQASLELCCYDFVKRNYPALIRRKLLTCPESAELPVWTRHIIREYTRNPIPDAIANPATLDTVLKDLDEVRNTGVRRVLLGGSKLLSVIEHARLGAEMLQDEDRITEIQEMEKAVIKNQEELSRRKQVSRQRLRDELGRLDERRQELHDLEEEAFQIVSREDAEIEDFLEDELGMDLMNLQKWRNLKRPLAGLAAAIEAAATSVAASVAASVRGAVTPPRDVTVNGEYAGSVVEDEVEAVDAEVEAEAEAEAGVEADVPVDAQADVQTDVQVDEDSEEDQDGGVQVEMEALEAEEYEFVCEPVVWPSNEAELRIGLLNKYGF